MTATPAGTTENASTGFGLAGLRRRGRPAGGLFGIDLAGLFKDEEGEGGGFQGFFAPDQVTSYYQGRSPGTLTYKAGKTPPQTVTSSIFKLAEEVPKLPSETPATTPAETKPETKADRLLSSFIGEMGDPNKRVLGAVGLGKAMEYGLSQADILSKAKQEGITFGEQAANTLGLSELTQYQGPLAEGKTIGLEALNRARTAGMSDELIKEFAKQQGVGFGEKAASQLGMPKVSDLNQYIGSAASGANPGTLGLEAVNRARQAGLSDQQITSLASQQGLSFGSGAASQLGVPSASQSRSTSSSSSPSVNLSSFIGSTGNQGTLGLEAINKARSSGLSDSEIRRMAASQGLGFGAAARSSLGL